MNKAKFLLWTIVALSLLAACASLQLDYLDSAEGPKQVRQGEDIALNSVSVWGIYKDGSRKLVSISASNILFDKNAIGPQTVRVRFANQEASFQTEVMALLSLAIASQPRDAILKLGQEADRAWPGLEVQGEWEQMGSQRIPTASCEITGYDKDRTGTQSITVSYLGKTASFSVAVRAMTVIQIAGAPAKVDYIQGESLNLDGLRVTGLWEGLPEEELAISAGDITGFNSDNVGIQRLTVTKNGVSATFNVEVLALTGIVIGQPPDKTDYAVGEALDLAGIVVNGNYAGTTAAKRMTQPIPANQLAVSGFNSNSAARQQRVTVTVRGQTANFFVNIAEASAPPPATTTPPTTQPPAQAALGPMTWTAADTPFANYVVVTGFAYANGKWIAVSKTGWEASSANGAVWTLLNLLGYSFGGIAYANGRWVGVGTDAKEGIYGRIAYSTDGTTWTESDRSNFGTSYYSNTFGSRVIQGIAYGNNRWIAVSSDGKMAYSGNAESWTPVDTTAAFAASAVIGAVWGNNRWVAVGQSGKIAYSDDNGVTWTAVGTSGFGTSTINSIAYGNNRWVAVGQSGKIAYSDNGTTWTAVGTSGFDTSSINSVAYGNGRWVAVGADGKMAYSADGATWTAMGTTSVFGTSAVTSVAYGGGKWFAGSEDGKVAYSDN
jgi:hypothetical protein